MPKVHPLLSGLSRLMAKKPLLLSLTIALVSGLLMGLAPAPLNAFPLAWIALAPLWVLVVGNQSRTIQGEAKQGETHPAATQANPHHLGRRCPTAWLIPLVWGMAYHGLALSWITGLHPLTWMGISWLASVAITLFCWGFITLWGAALVMIWAGLLRGVAKVAGVSRVLVGTALWCGLESIWSLGSLYWTSLAYTQSPGNLAILHLGQISGPLVVTAAIVSFNGLLAEAWIRAADFTPSYWSRTRAGRTPCVLVAIATLLLVTLHLVGAQLSQTPLVQSGEAALKVGIVQGNVPTRLKHSTEGLRRSIEGYVRGYETLADQGAQAVLTPEGAFPFLWDDRDKARNAFYQAVLQKGSVGWLSTFVWQENRVTQSLLSLTGTGAVSGRYDKIKIVPLGEYIPFREALGGLIDRLSPIKTDLSPGSFDQQFDTSLGPAIASICYDSAFPEIFRAQAARGGQFILTASNLDPYSEVLMAQHQAQDVMRAIETDRWAVRATNTGYSGIIDPHGRIRWRSQPHIYETHVDTIYRRQTPTLYVRWGDWFTPWLVGMAAIVILFQAVDQLRTRRSGTR